MVLALLLTISAADWVPARWISSDPKALDLLKPTPINCLLLERDQWSAAFAEAASARGMVTLGVIRPGGDPREAARLALGNKLSGIVLEGDFPLSTADQVRDTLTQPKAPVIEMLPRRTMRLRDAKDIAATYQAVWPGIRVQESGATVAGPSGAPWLDTNTGFLLFARAATGAPIWIGNPPPSDRMMPRESYLHAICDAAVLGARWVMALDLDFRKGLLAGDAAALRDWNRLGTVMRYFEDHKEWRRLPTHGHLAVVQDADSGALTSGGILDMIVVKHTPARVVPRAKLSGEAVRASKVVLNVEDELLAPPQKDALNAFTRSGGMLLTTPAELKPPVLEKDRITLDEKEVTRIDDLWKGMNTVIGRNNFGVRLFNVASILSNLLTDQEGKRMILHLVNYADSPVENVTARFLSEIKRATILAPGAPARDLEVYREREETIVEIDKVDVCVTLILE